MSEEKNQSEQTNKVSAESGLSSKYLGFSKKIRNNSGLFASNPYELENKDVKNIYTVKKESRRGFGI